MSAVSPRVLDDDITTTYPCSEVVVLKGDESVNDCCHPRTARVSILVWPESVKPNENHTHTFIILSTHVTDLTNLNLQKVMNS